MKYLVTGILLVTALLAVDPPAFAAGENAPAPAPAVPARMLLFNLAPGGSYQVRRNNVITSTPAAGPDGVLAYETTLNSGDRFEFMLTGVDPVTPSAPTGFTATGSNTGCVTVSWNPPPSSDYVTGYSLLWGPPAGNYADSVSIDAADVSRGAKWISTQCGFASGNYVFALRAHNAFDRWSGVSAPASATIGNEDTHAPAPPTNVAATETTPGCVTITWKKPGDPQVVGYRVFFGRKPRAQADYTDSLDAGNNDRAEQCGLATGTYYFAVQSYANGGLVGAFSKEVMLTAKGADVTPPAVSQRMPSPNATGVPRNAAIYFVATDAGAGVDDASISVTVDGQPRSFVTRPTADGLAVQCVPATGFAPDSDVSVHVSVSDAASPANVATIDYSFHTGTTLLDDTAAPLLSSVSPLPGAQGADPRPIIEVRLRDGGLGVSLASIVMQVNGSAVSYTLSGNPEDARLRYQPGADFPAGTTVTVHVEACDIAASPNCAPALDYEFSVAARSAMLSGQGAIVPDGYWAHDPTRPLEIRNLPARWTVRIFDPAGLPVRIHENDSEGATWSWNFHNDQGQKVAPALYLVRVTDASGAVQRSGRFLVQSR